MKPKPIVNPYTTGSRKRTVVTPDQTISKKVPKISAAERCQSVSLQIYNESTESANIGRQQTIHMQPTIKPKVQAPPPCIGRLRERRDTSFCWIGQPLQKKNDIMGRVYFQGFVLRGKTYNIGDVVALKSQYLNQTVCIVSAFQATKSFQGNAYDDGNFYEIQKCGRYKVNN